MYYIEDNEKIILFDNDIQKIKTSLEFLPQYKNFQIKETEKNIAEFEGKFYFEDDKTYIKKKNEKERQRIDNLSLTKREIFLALYNAKGLTPDTIRGKITNPAELIEFDYAAEYLRGNPLINKIGELLNITPEEIDYLFINKKLA